MDLVPDERSMVAAADQVDMESLARLAIGQCLVTTEPELVSRVQAAVMHSMQAQVDQWMQDLKTAAQTAPEAPCAVKGTTDADEGVIKLAQKVHELQEQLAKLRRKGENVADSKTQGVNINAVKVQVLEEASAAEGESAILDQNWTLQESSWDATLLIGHPYIGVGGSVILAFMVLVNIVMQLAFIALVIRFLSTITFPSEEIQGFHYFRSSVAHSVQLLDVLTEQTLAARVCDVDASLHVGIKQSDAIELVDDYMSQNAGYVMCLVASLTWTCTVLSEIRSSFDYLRALLEFGRRRSNLGGPEMGEEQIGMGKLTMLVVLLFLRVGIACFLLVGGLRYLAYTVYLPDLLLNAVALELVLTLDEITYAALAPLRVRRFIDSMDVLQLREMRQWKGMDMPAVASFLACIGFLLLVSFQFLGPQLDQLNAAKWELCHGEKDFTYGGSADGWFNWAMMEPSDPQDLFGTTKYNVIRQLIETPRDSYNSEPAYGLAFTDIFGKSVEAPLISFEVNDATGMLNVIQQANMDQREISINFNHFCEDFDKMAVTDFHARWLASLRDALRDDSLTDCSQVLARCFGRTVVSIRVRQACPQTCGCHTPASSLVPNGVNSGCPANCIRHGDYIRAIDTAPCEDQPTEGLAKYTQGYKTFYEIGWQPGLKFVIDTSMAFFDQYGCLGNLNITATFGPNWDFCAADTWPTGVKSLKWYCPVLCGCVAGVSGCPSRCNGTAAGPRWVSLIDHAIHH